MDHQVFSVELEPDDLGQVSGRIGPDGQNLGRVGIGIEVDHRDRMVQRMTDRVGADVPLERGSVKLLTRLS